MILTGCFLSCEGVRLNHKTYNSKSYYLASSSFPHLPAKSSSCTRSLWRPYQEFKLWSSKGSPLLHLAAASTPLLSTDRSSLCHTIPVLLTRRRPFLAPRASKDGGLFNFKYPAMTKKPRWWWRTLACLPYFMPLHEPWMYAETAYNLHPFLEDYEFLTYPFLRAVGQLPRWYILAYFILAYLCIVRRKEWPHFFRFHVAVGLLLEISLQVTGLATKWLPRGIYWGKIGMHFWTAVAFGFLFTVLECMRCALVGSYADVPFVSDAAYIQMPHD